MVASRQPVRSISVVASRGVADAPRGRAGSLVLACCAAVAWLALVSTARADLIVRGYAPQNHDRYYVGIDRAFIGEGRDWSGVGMQVGSSLWGTMISPTYFLSANHLHPSTGGTLRFYHTNSLSGGFEDRTVLGGVQISGTDLWLGQLTAPVSSSVAQYAIYGPPTPAGYVGLDIYTVGLASTFYPSDGRFRLGRNQIDVVGDFTVPSASSGPGYAHDYDAPTGGVGPDESKYASGDSGGPSFAIIDNQLALTGIHWFIYTDAFNGGSGDTRLADHIAALNSSMIGESVIVAVPEPTSLLLAGSGVAAAGLAGWRRRARRQAS